ncbi:MAG: hypothetical protein JXA93_10195 [Anaerolineae bacterium]|nr:hypothetical protein [Anaerolineae bacterium]
MRFRDLRKHLLAAMAVLNLGFWLALACLAGLLLGDQVDLGFETVLRQAQATAVVAWERQTRPTSPVVPGGAPPVAPAVAPPTVAQAAGTTRLVVSATPSPLSDRSGPSPTPALDMPAGATSDGATSPSTRPSRPASVEFPTPVATSGQSRPTALPTLAAAATRALSPAAVPSRPTTTQRSPTAASTRPHVMSSPTQALSMAPLLLADPAFTDLSELDAEMDRSASGRPVQIRYQETALNREIAALLAGDLNLPYHDVLIDLRRDHVVVTGKVSVLGFEVNAAIEGTIVARDCRPQFDVESVSVASIVTPDLVKRRVAEMLHEAMAWYPADYALCIEQIVIEEAKASIYGTRR